MTCLDYQDLLQRRLDGEGVIFSPDLEQHLSQCSTCAGLHASSQQLLDGLQALTAPTCPPGFAERVTALVLEERRLELRRLRFRIAVSSALAASVLLAALAGYFLLPGSAITDRGPGAMAQDEKKRIPPDATPSDSHDEAPALAQSAAGARQAFAALTARWANMGSAQGKAVVVVANPIDLPDFDDLPELAQPVDLEPAVLALRQARDEVRSGLQPVATTARRALAYFARELPVNTASR